MQYPGYEVAMVDEKVIIRHVTFDETELDSSTNWSEAWENQDPNSNFFGYVKLEAALGAVERLLAITARGDFKAPPA